MLALTEEQRLLLDALDDIVTSEFADRAFTWESVETPWPNLQLLADHGFMGINYAEEYGGGGLSEIEAMLATERIGRTCPDTAWHYGDQHFLAARAIHDFGSPVAKQDYLPPVVAGDERIAIAMSEPGAGSDLRAMTTSIDDTDGSLVLNGEKVWVSHANDSRAAVVWAQFPESMGSVVIELDWDGVEFAHNFTNMAGETQSQLLFTDVSVPTANVLTRGEDAFTDQLTALNWERLGSAAMANGTAMCAMDKALAYAEDRVQFGQPIGDFQGIEWKLADMATEIQASRAIAYRAAATGVEHGVPDPLETMIAKYYSARMCESVVSDALQIHGANGYQRGHPLEYLYRFARGYKLAGGTNEIQKNTIARYLKKNGFPRLGA